VATIRDCYVGDTRDPTSGKQRIRQREGLVAAGVNALEGQFAEILRSVVDRRERQYRVKVSAGQPDRSFVLVPYAALLRKDVTSTPRRGVYVALLFRQDCRTLWLTLNQGLLQFENRFGLLGARDYLKKGAKTIGNSIASLTGFSRGSINLNATTPYGQAYEQGAILSRQYALDSFNEATSRSFLNDLESLVDLYDSLPAYAVRDPSIAVADEQVEDDEMAYQEMANSGATNRAATPINDVPRPRPLPSTRAANNSGWIRDVKVAIEALEQASFSCEAGCSYEPFRAAVADRPYVEAHHLIPFSKQKAFEVSLDVPANVVCLCPACHSKIHNGHESCRVSMITRLFERRTARLKDSGLCVSLRRLLAMY
jgi:5-methylcytosine-specific restriction protein A